MDLDSARERLHGTVSTEVLEVFDFYKLMLGSDQLTRATELQIANGESVFSALRCTVEECATVFETAADPLFQARGEDVRNIGNRLFNALLGEEGCATNGFDDFDRVSFWQTPVSKCESQGECVPYYRWVSDYIGVIGGR